MLYILMSFIFGNNQKTTRFFVIDQVSKPGQKNKITKGLNIILSGVRVEQAARKALTALCKIKAYKGRCTLKVTLIEVVANESGTSVKRVNGDVIPMTQKTSGNVKSYKYKMQLVKLKEPRVVIHDGKEVTYKFKPSIERM
jgi:hypothetical protein